MNAELLVAKIEEMLGFGAIIVEDDDARAFHKIAWFASPAGIVLFGVTIFSGDGINWRVGGTQGMPGDVMRQLSQLHEVTDVQEKGESQETARAIADV